MQGIRLRSILVVVAHLTGILVKLWAEGVVLRSAIGDPNDCARQGVDLKIPNAWHLFVLLENVYCR